MAGGVRVLNVAWVCEASAYFLTGYCSSIFLILKIEVMITPNSPVVRGKKVFLPW